MGRQYGLITYFMNLASPSPNGIALQTKAMIVWSLKHFFPFQISHWVVVDVSCFELWLGGGEQRHFGCFEHGFC